MPAKRRRGAVGAAVAALVVGTLAFAGAHGTVDPACATTRAAVAHRSGGIVETQASLVPCVYRTSRRAMEPSLAFASDGRLLFQAWELRSGLPGGVPPMPALLRREAGGAWTDVSPGGAGTHPTSLDPYMHVDKMTGRIFTLDWIAHGVPFCSTLSFSDDQGESWTTSPLACGGFDGESIGTGPPVSSDPTGYPNLVYYCTGASLGSGDPLTTPLCSKSLNGGLTFSLTGGVPYQLTRAEGVFPGWAGDPAVGPDGTLYLPKRHEGMPYVAISTDEGSTWTRVKVASNGSAGAAPRMSVDGDGTLAYTWIGDDHLPYVATSRDRGATWSAPLMVAPPSVEEAALARIASGPDGALAIAYVGTEDAPGGPPYYAYCNVLLSDCDDGRYAGVGWNGYLALIDEPTTADPLIRTATVNAPGSPIFVGGCSADGACKAVLDFVDLDFDADGYPWGAFVDDCAMPRDFAAIFTRGSTACGDGVGEGIVLKLSPA